jgi:uncharacterized protein Yka (UPF0111/DUF47 family)
MRLLPRQEKFYHLFLEQASIIEQAAQALLDGVRSGNSHLAAVAERIRQLENKGDDIIHDIFQRLNQTFITPLDPEDIHKLSSRLDDVLDAIEEASYRIVSYNLEPIPPAALKLCEIVAGCAQCMQKAVRALEEDEPLLVHCIEINRLEDSADKLVRQAIHELFLTQKDPIALFKEKEILEFLEEATDRSEDVADLLQNVAVKNS